METPEIPEFLQLSTQALLDEFGAGRHKPGSGSAAALLGLIACKMIQTVVAVTFRNSRYAANFAQLNYVRSTLLERYEPFFQEAVQEDSVQFDRYHQAVLARNACSEPAEKRRLATKCREELMPATQIPFDIATHALDVAERGLIVYDLGARHTRGDSGVAISSALSACSGSLFITYLNLLQFREGQWALEMRRSADLLAERLQALQFEQFRRVSRIQAEGIEDAQPQLQLGFASSGEDTIS